MTVLGAVIIRITSKDGKQTEISAPEGSTIAVNDKGEVNIKLPDPPALPVMSPLDKLDPAAIPAAERFDWQPKELVAVLGEHRQRHWGQARCVAVSRDGKQIATGGVDGMVRFWDPKTCRERGSIQADRPDQDVSALAFSPDAKRLAVGLWERIIFYDLTGAQPAREPIELKMRGNTYRLALTSGGKRVIGADASGTLWIGDLTEGKAAVRDKRTGLPGAFFDLSADGRILAFPSAMQTVMLLDIGGAEVKETAVVPQPAGVRNLGVSPDGKRLAVGCVDNKVRLWDVSGKTPVARDALESEEPNAMRFSPDGKHLAIGYTVVRRWNVEGAKPIGKEPFGWNATAFNDLAFTPDGQLLVAAKGDGTIRFWDLSGNQPQERASIEPSNYLLTQAHGCWNTPVFSGDGQRLATVYPWGTHWWDLGQAAPAGRGKTDQRYPVGVAPDGKSALLWRWGEWSSYDWASDTPREGGRYQFGENSRFAVPLPGARNWVVGTDKGEIRLVERAAGKAPAVRHSVQAGEGEVRHLKLAADGRMLASAAGGTVKLWDLTENGPVLRETLDKGQSVSSVAFSPDNRMLAVSAGQTTTVWDVQERRPKQWTKWERSWEEARSFGLSFSPDSRSLAAATEAGKLVLRNPETGAIRKEWQLPGSIRWVTYAPDGRHLLTINGNGTGYILRLATPDGKPYAPAPKPPAP